jgi:hypothetical protein
MLMRDRGERWHVTANMVRLLLHIRRWLHKHLQFVLHLVTEVLLHLEGAYLTHLIVEIIRKVRLLLTLLFVTLALLLHSVEV